MQTQWNRYRSVLLSLTAHACLCVLLLVHRGQASAIHTRVPGVHDGELTELTFDPGSTGAAARRPAKPHPKAAARSRNAPAAPFTQPSFDSAPSSGASGSSALGNGDISIALPHEFPEPKPDLAALPRGTDGNVIIDVVIDAAGRIVQSTLTRGLAPQVNDAVLAAVQHWIFTPATRNGVAVASKQELVFHYERP